MPPLVADRVRDMVERAAEGSNLALVNGSADCGVVRVVGATHRIA